MAGIPGIPQNFAVQQANRQVLVSWSLSTGATSYTIQRSLDNVTYTNLTTVTGSPLATSYVDTAVTVGTQYWYKVCANGSQGAVNFTVQPNIGDTITINNVTFTAVSSSAGGTQFTIGTNLTATITNLATVINNTIPGDVGANPSATQLLLIAFNSTITQLSSALTGTTVVAFTGGGSSSFTTPLSIIPTATGEMSLAQIRLMARQRADRVNSNFVTDSECNLYINQAMFELYDLLVTVYEDYFIAQPVQFGVDGVTFQYPLPDGATTFASGINPQTSFVAPPLFKLTGVDLALNNATNAYVTVNKFNFIDRNRFVFPNTASTIYGVFNLQYRVLGNNIEFIPTPTAGQQIRLWYIPRMTQLLQDTDTTMQGISGWIEYVIVRTAIYILAKEESDVTGLEQQLIFLKGRIEQSASNRDAGQPDTISDTRTTRGGSFGNGFGSGGWGSGTAGY